MSENASDALKNAFLQSSVDDSVNVAVKAEDLPQGGGMDFSKHFFEPQPGNTYLVKFLPNPGGASPIEHRSLYRNLPDPERKGKSFHYVSSGNANSCPVLELFFDLFKDKKDGDAIADKKIDKYLGRTNQGCAKVQILHSPKQEEVGQVRLFTFSTFGPNATIANLIDQKLNPSKDMIAQGYEKEDIFNIFGSSVLSIVCQESTFEGGRKGRDFAKSSWAPKKRGGIAELEDGKTHEFVVEDLVNGALKPEAEPFFNAFVGVVTNPDYEIRRYFSYKEIDDERNDEETNKYLKKVKEKVEEIVPIIREKSLSEIAAYGKKATTTDGTAKSDASKNVLEDSLPEELNGSVMADEKKDEVKNEKEDTKEQSNDVKNILNS